MAVTLRPLQAVSDADLLEYSRRNPGYQFERTASGELIGVSRSRRSFLRCARAFSHCNRSIV